jgi:peptidoglycan-associated lipoprotein
MNKVFWPALLALSMTACGTTGQQASVEDRTEEPAATEPAPAAAPTTGAESTGVTGADVAGSALPTDPRKDPASPLATRSIYFDYDSYVVKDEYSSVLAAHADYLKSKADARLILQGNADERGSHEYNLALGQKRAEAVRKALAVLGVNNAQLEAISFGEEKPRATGSDEQAYAENRRADVVYGDE